MENLEKQTPVVATSLNPFGRFDIQMKCFDRWQALGADIRTFNNAAEAEQLMFMGIDENRIVVLDDSQTGAAYSGKPVPRILPTLTLAVQIAPQSPVLLVNSDIYPAIRGIGAFRYWLQQADALALTREESIPEIGQFLYNNPYRGGLDCFLFSPSALNDVLAELSRYPSAERMAFGIPGWDYLVGAVILKNLPKGKIADSGVFLHSPHQTTYSDLKDFEVHLEDMNAILGSAQYDVTKAAAEFAQVIDGNCRENGPLCSNAKAIYFEAPNVIPGKREKAIFRKLTSLSPALGWHLQGPAIAKLAALEIAAGRPNFDRAMQFFIRNPDLEFQFVQVLLTISFCLECLRHSVDHPPITRQYPEENLHAKVVQIVRDRHPEGSPGRRLEFVKLFGVELISHGIFNPIIFNYLVSACETDEERALLLAIRETLEHIENVAA